MEFKALRESVYEANMELDRKNLVTYSFGNGSGIDRDSGTVIIKPSGVPYENLTPESMVLVNIEDGTPLPGQEFRPSSDTRTHCALYRAWPELGGVAHTHSTHATAWAQAHRGIPCYGTTHADYAPGEIPCTSMISKTAIAGDYETNTGEQIIERFYGQSPMHFPMVLVAGHGPFTWGDSPEKAAYHAVILEEVATSAMLTERLNPKAKPIPEALIEKHFFRKHGSNATYGQD